MDGGRSAITGFAVQVAVAILDSFTSDWIDVTLEPASETIEYDKVDILWRFPNEQVEFVQVKGSKNAFSPGKIEEWANEIRAVKSEATKRRLVLVGIPSASGMALVKEHAGVTVEIVP